MSWINTTLLNYHRLCWVNKTLLAICVVCGSKKQQTCAHIGVPNFKFPSTSSINCILVAEASSLLSRWRPQLHFPDYISHNVNTNQTVGRATSVSWMNHTDGDISSLTSRTSTALQAASKAEKKAVIHANFITWVCRKVPEEPYSLLPR